jgi:hypothetical protein
MTHAMTTWPASEGWSGRRESNPRPTAWKAETLPLSYSRLRASPTFASSRYARSAQSCRPPATCRTEAAQPRRRKAGGEGRIRTSEAARATDLQSAAFDRSATSPLNPLSPCACPGRHPRRDRGGPGTRSFVNVCLECPARTCWMPLAHKHSQAAHLDENSTREPRNLGVGNLELAKGFEPPTG